MQDIAQEEWGRAEKRIANGIYTGPDGMSIKLVKLLGPRIKSYRTP